MQLSEKVWLLDGGWGTELDKLGCPPGGCREAWNLTQPDKVAQVASSYVQAGSRIILTNTFGANRFVLEKYGLADELEAINTAGAELSRSVAGKKAHVFGSIGPTGKIVMMDEVSQDELHETFKAQADALKVGGAEGLVVETMTELAEAVSAVKAARATDLPVVACMTFDSGKDKTHTVMGVSVAEAVEGLLAAGADAIGCNCGSGHEHYVEVVRLMREATDKPLWVKPNAGSPEIVEERVVYRMSPAAFGDHVEKLIESGANLVGGCCGTTPEFIRELAARLAP